MQYRYGNYDRYYGYRSGGSVEQDPRLSLLQRGWVEGRDVLDVGCNTGLVSVPTSLKVPLLPHLIVATADTVFGQRLCSS